MAPLLAGFAVTLIGLVLQITGQLRWPDAALILLGAAAVLFLQVVQVGARARGYAVTPAQAREWYADADDPQRQAVLAWELRHHRACWQRLVRHAMRGYNLGILALLAGIVVMLVPRLPAELTTTRKAAIAVIALGGGLELLELSLRRAGRVAAPSRHPRRRLLRWIRGASAAVVPPYPPVPPPPFPGVVPAAASESEPAPRSPRPDGAMPAGQGSASVGHGRAHRAEPAPPNDGR